VEIDVIVALSLRLTLEEGRIVFTTSKGLIGVGLPRKAGRNDEPCALRYPDGHTKSCRLGWEDVQPKDGQPQVPNDTVIERPVMDDTMPGGPVRRVVQ
jgi:hypothetical protein